MTSPTAPTSPVTPSLLSPRLDLVMVQDQSVDSLGQPKTGSVDFTPPPGVQREMGWRQRIHGLTINVPYGDDGRLGWPLTTRVGLPLMEDELGPDPTQDPDEAVDRLVVVGTRQAVGVFLPASNDPNLADSSDTATWTVAEKNAAGLVLRTFNLPLLVGQAVDLSSVATTLPPGSPATAITAESIGAIGQEQLDAFKAEQSATFVSVEPVAHQVPAGLGWDNSAYPLTLATTYVPGGRPHGTAGLTPESAFDAVSTARTAPTNTYYVDVTGFDTTGTGAVGAPFRSIWKAVAAGNTAAAPYKVIVKGYGDGALYPRGNNPWNNNGTGITPTQDVAFIADGRVSTGTFDLLSTLTVTAADATYTMCATVTSLSSVERVLDVTKTNRFGNYVELLNVASPARCNATPGSWHHTGTTLYINRGDGITPTDTNTRFTRPGVKCFRFDSPTKNVYIGGLNGNSGFDCVGGGQAGGPLEAYPSPAMTADKVLAVSNSTFRYAGGTTYPGARGVSIESWRGLVVLSNVRADANYTDGLNFHNVLAVAHPYVLTVNCSARDNGRSGGQSCNGLTLHEDVIAVDVAGRYQESHGGAVRNINSSKHLLAGTVIEDDLGDVVLAGGGSMPPTAVRADDTAEIWCDRTRVVMPPGTAAYTARGTATVRKRGCVPVAAPDDGNVVTY